MFVLWSSLRSYSSSSPGSSDATVTSWAVRINVCQGASLHIGIFIYTHTYTYIHIFMYILTLLNYRLHRRRIPCQQSLWESHELGDGGGTRRGL